MIKLYGWEIVFYSESKQLENTPNSEAVSSQGVETTEVCPAALLRAYQKLQLYTLQPTQQI